jgi:hypothetical protein
MLICPQHSAIQAGGRKSTPIARGARSAAASITGVAVVTLGLACGSDSGGPTGPLPAPIQQAAFGDSVAGSLAGGDSIRRYSVHPPRDGEWAVFLDAASGNPALMVRDSATGATLASLAAPGSARPLLGYRTPLLSGSLGHSYLIEVRQATHGAASFRFLAYQADPTPESRADTVSLDHIYSGESLATSADIDEYHFSGKAGDLVVAEFQGEDGETPGALSLSIVDSAGASPAMAQVWNDADSLGLAGAVTARTTLTRPGRFIVKVTGVPSPPAPGILGTGRYRFKVSSINTAPESGPESLTARDSIDAALDDFGDIDEFTFTAAMGDQFRLFLRNFAPQGSNQAILARVFDPSGLLVSQLTSPGAAPSLFSYGAPLFTAPTGGTYRVRFEGVRSSTTGAYRFILFRLSPGPERISATLVPGDTVTGEFIDIPGDSDAFAFQAQAGQWVNLCLEFIGPAYSTSRLTATLTGPTGAVLGSVASFPDATALLPHTSRAIRVPATGAFTVRVTSDGPTTLGAYRLLVGPIDPQPETLPVVVPLDDSIVGESLDTPQDIDEFTVTLQAGDRLRPFVAGVTGLRVTLFNPDGSLHIGYYNFSDPMPVTGNYSLRVQGDDPIATGPYSLYLYHIDPRPEHFTGTLAAGDSNTVEQVDRPSDIDSFPVRLPGTDAIAIRIRGALASSRSAIGLLAMNGTVLGGVQLELDQRDGTYLGLTGRIPLAGPGSAALRVIPEPETAAGSPYSIIIDSISYGVETRSDTMVAGEVVDEALAPVGDVDEYVFRGSINQSFNLTFDTLPGSFVPTLLDLQHGDTVSLTVTHTAPMAGGGRETGRFDLPSSGFYKIRLRTPANGLDLAEQGPYRFTFSASDTMPEHDPPVIATGDSVAVSDGLDTPGDVDRFTFTSFADSEIALDLRFRFPPLGYLPYMEFQFLAASGDSAVRTVVADGDYCAGDYGALNSIGQAGLVRIQARELRGAEPPATTGSYGFTVHAIHRAPETLAATVVVDTFYIGERIDYCGDIDEFRYAGIAGDSLIAYVADIPVHDPDRPLELLQIIDPNTNQVIADMDYDPAAFKGATVKIALPHDGQYVLRVSGVAGKPYRLWLHN